MEIKGKVVANLGLQKGTSKAGKEWAKSTVVIEYGDNPQYPKKVALDNMKNADNFAALAVGTEGIFHIEVESREFNGRWYTSASCWKWETTQQPQPAPAQPVYQQTQTQPQTQQTQSAHTQDDGLPF